MLDGALNRKQHSGDIVTNYRRIAAILLTVVLAGGITAATSESASAVNGVRIQARVNGV